MNNAATAKAARHPWRSVGAVLAGLIFIVVTHLGTDTIMNPTDSIAIREANLRCGKAELTVAVTFKS